MSPCDRIEKTQVFDYSFLAVSHRKAIQAEVLAIRGLLRQTAESIVQIGLRLQFVRDLLGRNQFQGWLTAEFGWSQPTASRYMRVAAMFSDVACIKHFQPSALYLLAQNRVDASVRNAAISRAAAGQPITRTTVEQLLEGDETATSDGNRPSSKRVRNYLARIARDADEDFIVEFAEMLIQMGLELKQRK